MISEPPPPTHRRAVFLALFVTFLWSTSWVLIKLGLRDMPALSFAGMRYALAFFCLLPFGLRAAPRSALLRLTRRQWISLIVLGVIFYTVVQGAQFIALTYMPAAAVSLVLNFSSVFVALIGLMWLNEPVGLFGRLGIGLSILGGLIFFYPPVFPGDQTIGLAAAVVGMLMNAVSSGLGRRINAYEGIPPLVVTMVSMGIGGVLLLALGGALQGLPRLDWNSAAIIVWLAVVNTALAFTLWNNSLRAISALESSLIAATMMAQIGILTWIFLGEALTLLQITGMVLAGSGAMVVLLRRRPRVSP